MLDAAGQMVGVMATRDAQRLADQQGLDLVEVSPNAEPPVCKIMDYGKFRYEESIRHKQARKNQKIAQIKEVKFHSGVDTNDLEHKIKQMKEFIAAGQKVKVTLQYRGRENAHKELGQEVVNKVIEMMSDVAVLEQPPRLLGRVLGCLLMPRVAKTSSDAKRPQQPGDSHQPQEPGAPFVRMAEVLPPFIRPPEDR